MDFNRKVLFVDDEPEFVSVYRLLMGKTCSISTAYNPIDAIDLIEDSSPFAVIVADYYMHEMNGVDFLTKVQKSAPDTVRILLTGQGSLSTSIDAVNKGKIFKYLLKTDSNIYIQSSIEEAIKYYNKVIKDKQIFSDTFRGSIKMLIDILSSACPAAYEKSLRICQSAKSIAERINIMNLWELEMAALLSHVGCLKLPHEIINKACNGEKLTHNEEKTYSTYVNEGFNLVKNIPQLEEIANFINYQLFNYDGKNNPDASIKNENIPIVSRILKISNDYDSYIQSGLNNLEALKEMQNHSSRYDILILNELDNIINGKKKVGYNIRFVSFKELRIGMIISEPIMDDKENKLIKQGEEITDEIILKLIQISKVRKIKEPIKIIEYINENYNT